MLNNLESSIIDDVTEINTVLENDGLKTDIAVLSASIMMKLRELALEDKGFSDEFFTTFYKSVPVKLREIFLFGSVTSLRGLLED